MRLPSLPIMFAALAAAALLLWVARIFWHSYRGALRDFERTPPTAQSLHPALTGIPGLQAVSFAGSAGESLAAWYVPTRNGAAIVLLHGTGAERSSLSAETAMLAAAGFGVLALDLPGQGQSDGHSQWGEAERLALSASLDWLEHQPGIDPRRLGAFGLSFGGYVLLQSAAREPRLRAIVLASTPLDLDQETRQANAAHGWLSAWPALWVLHRYRRGASDLAPAAALRALAPRELLVISGERDRLVTPADAGALFAAALEPKELWIVPGAGHAAFAAAAPATYGPRLAQFFARALAVSAAPPSRG
jgi:dipeptidyl aminopeptidase/acylaminoacyl peptidase